MGPEIAIGIKTFLRNNNKTGDCAGIIFPFLNRSEEMMRWNMNTFWCGNKLLRRSWWLRWKVLSFPNNAACLVWFCMFCLLNVIHTKNDSVANFLAKTSLCSEVFCFAFPLNSVPSIYVWTILYIKEQKVFKMKQKKNGIWNRKTILEQSVLKYWTNPNRFWSIKWRSKNVQETLKVWGFGLCARACQSQEELLCWFQWV